MKIHNPFSKPLNIQSQFYDMASADDSSVDVNMYGDVVNEVPINWWTGEPIPGDYIVLDAFLSDLDRLSGFKNINIHINSYGGDCVAAFVIHNKLREFARDGKKLTCTVDGVAMSSGSLIMSACDTVRVNAASLVMIHKCWTTLWGGYNADELRDMAEQNSAYDKAIASAYARKTGMSETQILHMMGETTYMTGKEALEKGFADELIEDAEPLELSASADGRSIFVRGREMHLAPGMFAPDSIPTKVTTDEETVPHTDKANTNEPEVTGKGGISMTKDELRAQYPDLIAEVEADAAAGNANAVNSAVQAERTRLSEIDQIAGLYSDEMVRDAKYGDNACTAQELAYRAAQDAVKKGNSFMSALEADSNASCANNVPSAQAEEVQPIDSSDDMTLDMAKNMIHDLLNKKEAK